MSEGGPIEITIRMGDESMGFTFPAGTTVGALTDRGHLRSPNESTTRVNGAVADQDTVLYEGDSVAQTKAHGTQG